MDEAATRPDVDRIRARRQPLTAAGEQALEEKEHDDLDIQERKARLYSLARDIRERKKYAGLIYRLVVCWLVAVFLILIASGNRPLAYELSDQVLITLVSGTTINVLGLFAIVANYLFPKR